MEPGKGDRGDLFGTARKELYFRGVHFLWVLHTRLPAEQQKTYPFHTL